MAYTFKVLLINKITGNIIVRMVNCANAESALYIATAIYDGYTIIEIEQE